MVAARVVLVVVLALGCGTSAPADPPMADPSPAPVARVDPERSASPIEALPAAPGCRLTVSVPRRIREHARWPAVALGESGAVVTSGLVDPPREGLARARDDVLVIGVPVASGPIREVFTRRALEATREYVLGPFVARLAGEATAVSCFHDDFCADRMEGLGTPCEAWACDVRVPGRPAHDAHFAIAHQRLGFGTAIAFHGSTVFAAAMSYRSGMAGAIFGFVVQDGVPHRVLVHSFGEDAYGNQVEIDVVPENDDAALVGFRFGDEEGWHWNRITAQERTDATAPEPAARPALAVVERRASGADRPRLVAIRNGVAVEVPELGSTVGRFAPTLLTIGSARVLVFSEGLDATTRIRAVVLDDAGRPIGEPVDLSPAGVEAGRAAADALGETGLVVWEARPDAWELQAAVVRCAPR